MRKLSRFAIALTAVAALTTASLGTAGLASAAPAAVTDVTPPSSAEQAELIRLSDPATLRDLHDGQQRMERITQIFVDHNDRAGIFAVFYRNILRDANPLLDAGDFDDPAWARDVSAAFFHRYLENLHAHLTGGPVTPQWQRYYAMAADPAVSAGRVAGTGLDAHLLIDFPAAIAETHTTVANTRDFFAIGDSLIGTTSRITDELRTIYGAKLAEFFHLYFVGSAADLVIGEHQTTYVLFQGIRGTSLASGIAMTDPITAGPAELSMQALYDTAETVFSGLAAVGQI
ncbi:DUF5995 family protein [Nocardia sp. NPDC051832]|uniref:DUF5995 family protein n=1 Tax=Nocardia sp. NPDC051832 TaxID=3155673 RepID=UPI00342581A3